MPVRVRLAVGALVASVACAGCGFGPGTGSGAVSLRVSRDFGATPVKTVDAGSASGGESILGLLRDHFTVTAGAHGGSARSIAHLTARGRDRWFLYVNGVAPRRDAAATHVHRGDHVWWDLHDGQDASPAPAVVGSFPEPFLHGINGRRYPTTLECDQAVQAACQVVSRQFARDKIPASPQVPGTGSGPDTLSINVGLWSHLAPEVAGALIDKGPEASGVYARFTSDHRHLELLDPAGGVVRTLGPGAGLVAATADSTDVPTWMVGGTDRTGVMAAARAVTAPALAGHFALAVQGSRRYPLPLAGP